MAIVCLWEVSSGKSLNILRDPGSVGEIGVNARGLLRSDNLDRPLVLPFFVEIYLYRIRTPAVVRQLDLTPTPAYRAPR